MSALTPNPSACDPRRLNEYVDGRVLGPEQTSLEKHLSICEACCRQIESLAADRDFWSEATRALDGCGETESSLGKIDLRLATLASKARVAQTSEPMAEDGAARNQVEMLQRWLEPSTLTGSLGKIGKYEVISVVGQGGMGLVLKAFDTELNREVAIKTMAHHVTSQPDASMRLTREARAVAGLSHPNIVPIYALESWRDVPLIVMPLINGGTLQQYARQHPPTIDEILTTSLQIASALAGLHTAGIVHRDLKPSNILLKDGLRHILLSDFGLARVAGDHSITQSDVLAGTPNFMSPEQALGQNVDVRSDLFSLGSVLYWLCAGACPFQGKSSYDTLEQIVHGELQCDELERRAVPGYLQQLIRSLLAKDPSERWASATRVVELLQLCLAHHRSPELALPPELSKPLNRVHPPWRSSTLFAIPVFATFAALVWLGAAVLWPQSSAETADDPSKFQASVVDPSALQSGSASQQTSSRQQNTVRSDTTGSLVADIRSSQSTARAQRYGPLDPLDRLAMLSDLAAGKELHYWLGRMADLQVEEIPIEALPALQTLVQDSDLATCELAQVILNKNPFQEVRQPAHSTGLPERVPAATADNLKNTETATDNPFEEVMRK